MFITVEHGDGKILLVNPECNAVILQDYVRRACNIKPSVTVDFSDEHANLTELFTKPPLENMFDYFMPRSTFVLVQVDRGTDGSITKVTPLLTDWEKKYPFMERKLRQRDKKTKQALAAAEKDGKDRGSGRGSKLSVKSESPTSQAPSKTNIRNGKNSAKGDRTTGTTPNDTPTTPKKTSSKGKKKVR